MLRAFAVFCLLLAVVALTLTVSDLRARLKTFPHPMAVWFYDVVAVALLICGALLFVHPVGGEAVH